MQTPIEFSAGMFIRVALGVNTVESGGKKRDRAEGKIKLDHWLDDLSLSHGASGVKMALQGCPDTSNGQVTSTWKGHCMQPGGLRLPTGSTSSSWATSP